MDTVKGIYSSLVDLLTKRQEYEHMPEDAALDEVKRHKLTIRPLPFRRGLMRFGTKNEVKLSFLLAFD